MVFEDELETETLTWRRQGENLLFNILLRGLPGSDLTLQNSINWFENRSSVAKPSDPFELIVWALDDTLASLGPRPWDMDRATIDYQADSLGVVWSAPWLDRSTYAQVVEVGPEGPTRIESMIPLGQSGAIYVNGQDPEFDPQYFGFTEIFDGFLHRDFPVFHESPQD